MLPDDLSGRSVLDVGCGSGTVARELVRRGAARVVAVDIDDVRFADARAHNTLPEHGRIEFRFADLEVALPKGPFDHVVCHDLLHRVRNPIEVLAELDIGHVDEDGRFLVRGRRRHVGHLVVVSGRNGTPERKREQKFFLSPRALHNLLMEQRRYFAELDIGHVDEDGRFLVRGRRRHVGHLVVVSGPTGAGKSTFLEQLQGGKGAVTQLGAVSDLASLRGYQTTNSDGLRELGADAPGLLFHHDLLRPWRRDAAVHQRDEGLHVFDCCQRLDVVVLVARASILRARLSAEFATLPDPEGRQGQRLREVLDLYAEPERVITRINA